MISNSDGNGDESQELGGTSAEYGNSEETAALLSKPTVAPPVVVSASSQNKPVLTRQDRATYLVASPQLSVSGLGGSEESATAEDPATRSVPDIELHCRLDIEPPAVAATNQLTSSHYRARHHNQYRCRCEYRRDSLAPSSALHLARSVSRSALASITHKSITQTIDGNMPSAVGFIDGQ